MKRYFVAIICVLTCLVTYAQIEWLDTVYDFGVFHEESGKQYGKIRFVNKSGEPTIINRVKTTCGCTVADYPKEEIADGDTAVVNFSFNPEGRLGKFEKAVKIYYGIANEEKEILIRGRIIGKSSTLKNQYPIEEGGLRLTTKSIILGNVVKGRSRHEFIHMYNQTNDTLQIALGDAPGAMSLGLSDDIIYPGEIATISIYFNSILEENLGLNIYKFDIVATGRNANVVVPIELTANVKEERKKLTPEEAQNAPMIFIEKNLIDLGNVVSGKIIKASFYISNEGKSELQIKRIYSIEESIAVKRMPTKLSAGDRKEVEIEIDSSKMPQGVFNVKLEIISNDPLHPTTMLRIVGEKK